MNRENLQKMADYIRTVPQEMFSTKYYRALNAISTDTKECNTVGCVIGHCTILDPRPIEELPKWPLASDSGIHFDRWSQEFTGIGIYSDLWEWLFSFRWANIDDTPEGAALRIEWALKNGLPKDWEGQMCKVVELCYKTS